MNITNKKFQNPLITAEGEKRASVPFKSLKVLWFNTGTRCNLSCKNCYIESSPKNDRLDYLKKEDILPYLKEVKKKKLPTTTIGLTGGEPFINPHIEDIIKEILDWDLELLILTNAHKSIEKYLPLLSELNKRYPEKLKIRVSLDHYTKEIHEKERGPRTFVKTLKNTKWMYDHGIDLSVAARSLVNEDHHSIPGHYQKLLVGHGIHLTIKDGDNLIIFPEMSDNVNVQEITVNCWGMLNKRPEDQMCATSRMIIKRKNSKNTTVVSCTLLAYDPQFELSTTLTGAAKEVSLNHRFCSQFCVLGGASCS